ncbi:hypothetical protein ACNHFY_004050, partial [Yersinia enterocolitica]
SVPDGSSRAIYGRPWRGRFTLLPVFTLQYRVVEVCQQSEGRASGPFAVYIMAIIGIYSYQ